jgi:HNH endonuclease
MQRKSIEFRQLCAVVRAVIQRNPTVDDAEWKAKVLETLAKMQFAEPPSDMLARAMTQVEFAVRKTLGPRPGPLSVTVHPPTVWRFEGRTNRPAGWEVMQRLLQTLQPSVDCVRTSNAPAPREELFLTEVTALNEFWHQAGEPDADRLALVRAFAEIAIIRSVTWNPRQIRAAFEALPGPLAGMQCFACRSDRVGRAWHHVIQIQHGGSNYVRNRIVLCAPCHTAVHPWLAESPRSTPGWISLADLVPLAAALATERA